MSIDRYDPIRILGEGSFGKVYLMRDKVKRNFVCVKIIKIKNIPKKEREATRVEVDLLRRLNHPNIVRYIDSFLSKNKESLCICMEYCDGGDLASQIKAARKNLFSESKILHWFVQLTLGLHYMHGNKVLHRDLKTQNVFMLGNGRLVLGDLGISKVLDGTVDFAQTCIGTPYYMSPEIFKNKPYSYKSDVWALGCVLYEMTTLNHAFDANSLNGLATKIVKGKYPPINPKYSKHLSELIGQMLQLNPQQRPDLDQILRKPFIKKHIVNFFTDIASRPSTSLGEGTMIFKAAAGGAVQNAAVGNDTNMISLRQQLHALGMTDAVSEALAPKQTPQDDGEAIKYAREQASALQREKEHKKMVEAALEKLRLEREARAQNRQIGGAAPAGMVRPAGYPIQQARYAGAPAVGAGRNARQAPPSQSPSNVPSRNPSVGGLAPSAALENARREAVRRQQAAVAGSGGDDASADGDSRSVKDPSRRRSFGEDVDRNNVRQQQIDRDRKATEDRRRAALAQQAQQAEDDRLRLEARKRDEARAEAKAREDARIRDESRAKEEVQARLKVEQIKVEQVRAQAEMAARAKREAQRDRERARQKEEIEQLKRDKIELDRRASERDRVREERRAQERVRLEGNRKEQMDVVQEKLSNMHEQLARVEKNPRPRGAPERAEEKISDETLARDRVMQRRQEKLTRDETEQARLEDENRRARQGANNNMRNQQYYGESNSPGYEFDADRGKVSKSRMDAGELNNKLDDISKGKGSRFDDNSGSNNGYDSASEEETESIFDEANGAPNAQEEDEDMERREEELRAELNFATCRVEELKRTLQETKSFLGPRLPTRGKDAPMTAKGREGPRGGEDVFEEEVDDEEDEDFDFDESDGEGQDESVSSQGRQPAPSHRHGGDHKLEIGDTVRMQMIVPQSAYGGLQDMPSPSGRLSDRIERLRQRCTEALGRDAFRDAYYFLKQHEEESQGYDNGRDLNDDDYEAKKISRMRAILGEGKAHYMSLIEQLIFMEETHLG